MHRLICALFLSIAAIASAHAEQPPASLYLVSVWSEPGGTGQAVSMGPLSQEQCGRFVAKLKASPDGIAPPEMQLRIVDCVGKGQLPVALVPFGCHALNSKAVPKMPNVQEWSYGCFRP